MPVSEEEKKEYVKAKLAIQAAKKTKDALPPVIKRPYDPENCLLSKAEFVEKMRKQKEDALAAKEFLAGRKDKKEDVGDGVQVEEKKEVAKVVKKGRPKKIE